MRFTRGIALLSIVLVAGCYVDDEIEPDLGGGGGAGGGETDGSVPDACDEGAVEACFVEGECRGERVCSNGAFGECTAPAEVCDGLDNDCDGEADEGYAGLGDACEAGEGACVDRGRVVCTEDGTDVVCDATPGDGTTDVCDSIDNDCDGTVDEEATLGEACDTGRLGVCTAGITSCADGDARCAQTTEASDEICDGLDNDCDGRVDEDGLGGLLAEPCYEGPEGTEGVGICAGGVRLCVDGAFDACTGAVTPLEEICDGLDNDCDGTVDTGDCACVPGEARDCYSGPEGSEGVGACAPGRQVCGADGTYGPCRGEVTPTAEACDGVDNDCDGAVDDVPGAGQPCTDGVGACAVDGARVCDLESGGLVCDAVAGEPSDELCDGLDNDCDGVVDDVEGVGELCTIGEGACFDRGARRCIDGALACDAVVGEPGAETCNQIDDDCNGEVDDVPGLDEHCEIGLGICRSTALTKCDYETGSVFCPATEQDPEPADYCGNRVDDDCDGEVDEEGCGFRCAVDDDCPGEGYCNGGLCVACLADEDCGDGEICVDGACLAPLDSDGDGVADVVDVDDDNDGIPDAAECFGAVEGQTSVLNGGFEVPPVAAGANRQTPEANVPGWETTEGPGSIEMWGTGFLGVPAAVGGAFAEINAFEADGALYQDIATIPGTIFTWSFYHRGRQGEDELELRAGPPDATVTITTAATGNQAWRRYTGTYVVPDGQMLTRFEFRSIRSTGGAGLGNFVDGVEFTPSCPADADADGDGIPNALDLDSDDDGIPDAEEAGHDQPHTDGRVDGPVGGNGLVDAIETVPDSGIIDYPLRDSDGDGVFDFLDADSGGAACPDGGAPGACPPGFDATPDGLGCERLTTEPAVLNGELLDVCRAPTNAAYGPDGAIGPGGTRIAGAFISAGGDQSRLNTVGIWACGPDGAAGELPLNEPIGFTRCLELAEAGDYVVGIAGDNGVRAQIDGEVIFDRQGDVVAHFRDWNLIPLQLEAGAHIITVEGSNVAGPAAFGAEIYGPFPAGTLVDDASLQELPYADNIVFSTIDQLGGLFETGQTSGYSCPGGAALDLCDGEPSCTRFERLDRCELPAGELCDNGADDDDDGAIDCEDRDCNLDVACAVTRTVYFTAPDDATFSRVPGIPTRLYTIDGAGNLQLLGDILLDGEPIAVSAIALSPDGVLVGFQNRPAPIGSRLIIIDPDTATAVVAGEYVDALFDGAAYAPDGTLYVTDDDRKQVRVYDDGLGDAVLDYPAPFLGADLAIDLDGSCYLTGVGPDFTQYELYACDLDAGTTESLGVYVNNPGFDRDGATTIPAMAFAYDPATCGSRLYAFDSLSVDELGYFDLSADPPTMNHIASTDINFAFYLTPDMAGFPSAANAPDCDGAVEICGDGFRDPSEECDDGGNIDGDGCAADCTIEDGFECFPAPADIEPVPFTLDGLTNCGRPPANPVPLDLVPWPAYRSFYLGGAVSFSPGDGRHSGVVGIAIDGELVVGDPINEPNDLLSPEAVEDYFAGTASDVFPVEDGATVGAGFFDPGCVDNAGTLDGVIRAVGYCARVAGEICDNGEDDDDDALIDCGDDDCRDDPACDIARIVYFSMPSFVPGQNTLTAPPSRIYALDSAGNAVLIGEITVDGEPAAITALAMNPDGELWAFAYDRLTGQSTSVLVDPATGEGIAIDDPVPVHIHGAGFAPDGTLYVLDRTNQQVSTFAAGLGEPVFDYPILLDGGDIAFAADGACYLTGTAIGGELQRDIYRCDVVAGTVESIGAPQPQGFADGFGRILASSLAFALDDQTCAPELYTLDGYLIDELGRVDVGVQPPVVEQIASTGINYAYFIQPDGAGFPNAINTPACLDR